MVFLGYILFNYLFGQMWMSVPSRRQSVPRTMRSVLTLKAAFCASAQVAMKSKMENVSKHSGSQVRAVVG